MLACFFSGAVEGETGTEEKLPSASLEPKGQVRVLPSSACLCNLLVCLFKGADRKILSFVILNCLETDVKLMALTTLLQAGHNLWTKAGDDCSTMLDTIRDATEPPHL